MYRLVIHSSVCKGVFSLCMAITATMACAALAGAEVLESSSQASPSALSTQQGPDLRGKTMKRVGLMRPSFYWISLEPKDGKPKTKSLLDMDGNVLAKVTESYYKKLLMEGTGRLRNGKLVNFKGRVTLPNGTSEIRWRFCGPDAPYGFGYEDIPLRPFHSVAIDPKTIPIGSLLYIPAAKGISLPNGTRHDGYFNAVDIGSMIQKIKIDIFVGDEANRYVFESQGLETGKMIEVFIVEGK